ALLMASCIGLAACTLGPDYSVPASPIAEDSGWGTENPQTDAATAPVAEWWKGFNDPTLEEVIQEAAAHNLDIRIALANVERARAVRSASIAPLFPMFGIGAGVEREGLSGATGRNRTNAENDRDTYNAGLDASWELDVFGYTRRAAEAAGAQLEAAEANRQDMQIIALAETAQSYFAARGLQKRITVTKENVGLLESMEELARVQFEAGVTTEFDLSRAIGERQQVQATLPTLEADLAATLYRLSVLTGKDPKHYAAILAEVQDMPSPPDLVPVGLRSDILRRRPDIRRAERELAATNAQIGVAVADLFPRFFLTGSAGSTALTFGDLFSSAGFNYTLGAALNWTVFSGGAKLAAVDIAKADNKAALLTYEKSVLLALEEAETSLVRYGKEWQALQQLRASEAQRVEAYNIAKLRYESGEENFLVILDSQRSLLATRDLVAQSEARLLSYLIQLYKALGGGWEPAISTDSAESAQ
ncbi:MAG: efflux transporter outer membrane subunit, partial [Alphaproteobacteria bacterium]|nr:efflux transporter outer membrane subunit [Alphaproteobacteria bacterium]